MGWPRGKPRKVAQSAAPIAGTDQEPAVNAGPRWKMKAQANWETMDHADDSVDRFHVPAHMIPEGMSLQWVTDSVFGQGQPQHRADFERKGWTPVHQEDFDGRFDGMFMPKGNDGEINNGGLVLMARPKEITDEATRKDNMRAKQQLAIKEAALRGGDIPGVTLDTGHKSALAANKVSRSWERIAVPTDDA
jgi:hypothetical protein